MKIKKEILIIFILYLLFCIFLYGKYGCLVRDSFREVLVPQAMLNGDIIYRDIIHIHPPLGLYLNTFLYKIFGVKLSVLYIAGLINAFFVWLCVYFILKEVGNKRIAFIGTLTILFIFIFRIGENDFANYIFPYSYPLIYAFSSCFISLLCWVFYEKRNNIKYLYLSFFFIGLSMAFKLDYSAFFVFLIIYSIIKLKSWKITLKSIMISIIPLIISLCICFINGVRIEDLIEHFKFLYKFSQNSILKDFNRSSFLQIPSVGAMFSTIPSLKNFILSFGSFFVISLFLFFVASKSKNRILCNHLIYFTGIFYIAFVIPFVFSENIKEFLFKLCRIDYYSTFLFLPYFLLVTGIILLTVKKIKKIELTETEKFYCLFFIVSLLVAYRNYVLIYVWANGNFVMLPFWILFIILLLKILPENIKKINNETYKNSIVLAFILYAGCFLNVYIGAYNSMNYKYSFPKGDIYVSSVNAMAFYNVVEHAKRNVVGTDKRIFCVDECEYLHYLLDIPIINMKMYMLYSHFLPVLGEDYVIDEVKKYNPDYIYKFIVPNDAHGEFGVDFGEKTYEYILENYNLVGEYPKNVRGSVKIDKYVLMIFERKD